MDDKKYTKQDIERLRAIKDSDPSKLKPEEIKYANLHPIEKGEVRNPEGRKKGTKNWHTHFQNLMGDEKFLSTIISQLPKQWEGVVEKYPASVIAAGLIATATQQVAKSIAEGKPVDEATLKIIDRIQRIGYGETKNVNIDSQEGGFFEKVNFNFSVVPDRPKEDS